MAQVGIYPPFILTPTSESVHCFMPKRHLPCFRTGQLTWRPGTSPSFIAIYIYIHIYIYIIYKYYKWSIFHRKLLVSQYPSSKPSSPNHVRAARVASGWVAAGDSPLWASSSRRRSVGRCLASAGWRAPGPWRPWSMAIFFGPKLEGPTRYGLNPSEKY